MNTPIIADTSAFISLGTVTDSNYGRAIAIGNSIKERNRSLVVPGEIFTETINTIGKKVHHKAAIYQGNKILTTKGMLIAETNPKIRDNALEKFKRQPESVSFTDCLVMAFADEFETKEIFGFDEGFKKSGYVRVGIDKR